MSYDNYLQNVSFIKSLLNHAFRSSYKTRSGDTEADDILEKCIMYFKRDYKLTLIENYNGELCGHYPSKLVYLQSPVDNKSSNSNESSEEELQQKAAELRELINKARSARCRARFIVPVILFGDKHICRAATLSGGPEIYGRQIYDLFLSGGDSIPAPQNTDFVDASDWQMFTRVRGQDIKLLKKLNIGYIFDLMVEKKKVKFGMNVTSSEKVDKEKRYTEFSIASMPYPGCEFFKTWRDSGHSNKIVFDWNQGFVDAVLDLPASPSPPSSIEWPNYRDWDLISLTQNYLKLLLHYINNANQGILVHCISGWDRTPLFISLIRLSLWAQGLIHSSLGAAEILYLTIAYDWFLFGHNFPERLSSGEEVFYFGFDFLQYITGNEFNIQPKRSKRTASRADSECHLDGGRILLDADTQVMSSCGGSSASLNSTTSSTDNNGLNSLEEDSFVNGMQSSNITLKMSPSNRSGNGCDHNRLTPSTPSLGSNCTTNSSSPLPVPRQTHRMMELKTAPSNASFGSWQFVESFKSSDASLPHSHRSSTSDHGLHPPYCDMQANATDTTRKQKLDEVRHIFCSAYKSITSSPDSGASFTGLFGNFAKKVGLRSQRTTFV